MATIEDMATDQEITTLIRRIAADLKKDELSIPVMPELIASLSKRIDDPNLTVRDLANVISVDTGLATQILRLSQILKFSYSGSTVTTLPNAITKLGLNNAVHTALAIAIEQNFKFHVPQLEKFCRKEIHKAHLLCYLALHLAKAKYLRIPTLVTDYIVLASTMVNISLLPYISAINTYVHGNKKNGIVDMFLVQHHLAKIRVPLAIAIIHSWKLDHSFEHVITLEMDPKCEFYVNAIAYAQDFLKWANAKNIKIQEPEDITAMIAPNFDESLVKTMKTWMQEKGLLS